MKSINLPIVASILMLLTFFFQSCQQEQIEPAPATPTVNPPTGGGTGSGGNNTPTAYFIQYELDGTNVHYVNGVNGFSMSESNGKSTDAPNDYVKVNCGNSLYFWDMTGGNDYYAAVSFDDNEFSLNAYSMDKALALSSIFTLGTHPYRVDGSINQGIVISMLESDGTFWSSLNVAQGSGSTFNVTESIASTDVLGNPRREVKGTFSGVVVSDGSGNTKTVNNGSFYMYFAAP